ncbi:MAG: heavy-metal-associated domain-containing protein [Planctomycetota bacterium]|jgi:copper chaperone CopZ
MVSRITESTDQVQMSGNIILKISGMTCLKSEKTIKGAVLHCKGVKDAMVSHKEAEAIIKVDIFNVDVNELKEAAENTGYSVEAMYFNTQI